MYKRFFLWAMLTLFTAAQGLAASAKADYEVVPLPHKIALDGKSPFILNGYTVITSLDNSPEMQRNAAFLADYIRDNTKLSLSVVTGKTKVPTVIQLQLDKKVKAKEGYVITVNNKVVTIKGSTANGVFYGIQTLRKSLPVVAEGVEQVELPSGTITDEPRFSYRGFMLDCGRHYFPLSFVKECIDLMALHNMNTFHWHLTEDQGWRLEIKKYPRLTEIGSKREATVLGHNSNVYDDTPYGGYYTQDEAREIVKYAAERYITVIPEIDMPGHQLSALACYPELGCTGGPYKVGTHWGVFPDVLCLGNEKTYQFCEDVLTELMDIFPSKYINIGGDESPRDRWKECPKCKAKMSELNIPVEKLQGYFTNRIEKFINSKGRSIIGWDEILEGDINQSATVMGWRGTEHGIEAAKKGHDVIMTPTTYLYFDYYQTDKQWNEPLLIGGNLPLEKTYSYEPIPADMDPSVKSHFIGVQANLWTEYIGNPSLAEYQSLPRMDALSEIQWTDGKKDYEGFKKRTVRMLDMYDHYGYNYAVHAFPGRVPSYVKKYK